MPREDPTQPIGIAIDFSAVGQMLDRDTVIDDRTEGAVLCEWDASSVKGRGQCLDLVFRTQEQVICTALIDCHGVERVR